VKRKEGRKICYCPKNIIGRSSHIGRSGIQHYKKLLKKKKKKNIQNIKPPEFPRKANNF
jgi:hypothetical protein